MSHPSTSVAPAVLFLSGAGLPAWIWDEVRAGLPERLDTVVARAPRNADASLADCADAAAAQMSSPTFAVVAHSVGGVVATSLLARHPGRVTAVLGIAAVVPRAGRSFVSSMPFPTRLVLGAVLRAVGTRPPAKAIRAVARGLPETVADRIVADFEPEPVRLYRDATPARDLPAVRAYVRGTEDRELSAAVLRASAATLQASWTDELRTGHLPMLEEPAGVIRAIRKLLAAAQLRVPADRTAGHAAPALRDPGSPRRSNRPSGHSSGT